MPDEASTSSPAPWRVDRHDHQQITRVRRQYNQWVADQTLEDYALRFTADKARRWSPFRVGSAAFGAISFLACEAIGGSLTLTYGFSNTILAIAVVSVVIFFTSLPIGYYASKFGVDMDLLTRGAGFGYIGSTITSLIYAGFTFILFAVEASIMSQALVMCLDIPIALAHVISALVVLPIAALGIRVISSMQLWTQPIWLVLQLAPLIYLMIVDAETISGWTSYAGEHQGTGFNLLLFGAYGRAVTSSAITFVSKAAVESDLAERLGVLKELVPVSGTRTVNKAAMIHNNFAPTVEVDPETYEVRVNGDIVTCEPAKVLAMAQRYFLF
jgi:hypothetical protein